MGYNNGKIYKITGNGLTYYGSTIQLLCNRKTSHKYLKRCISRIIIDKGDWKLELVEDFSCENKEQLLWRERWWIENNECINVKRPIITLEEKQEERKRNKQKYEERQKQLKLNV